MTNPDSKITPWCLRHIALYSCEHSHSAPGGKTCQIWVGGWVGAWGARCKGSRQTLRSQLQAKGERCERCSARRAWDAG
eukprot:6036736-Prymnesium_polylepis.1